MGKTVGELETNLTSAELSEWEAFSRIEPIPQSWHQTGLLCSLLANLLSTGRKRFNPIDFMPIAPPEQTPQEAEAMFMACIAGMEVIDHTAKP